MNPIKTWSIYWRWSIAQGGIHNLVNASVEVNYGGLHDMCIMVVRGCGSCCRAPTAVGLRKIIGRRMTTIPRKLWMELPTSLNAIWLVLLQLVQYIEEHLGRARRSCGWFGSVAQGCVKGAEAGVRRGTIVKGEAVECSMTRGCRSRTEDEIACL